MKKQNGITLIALVISIIVMLILAGVSINAVIGDNGIIAKAQEAKMLSGMAVLEEYLQEEYFNYFEESDAYINKIEMLSDKKTDLLLTNSTIRKYVMYSGKAYYLINKGSLPDNIKDALTGGDSVEVADFTKLYDVYGVTPDLKVYYIDKRNEAEYGNVQSTSIDPNTSLALLNNNSNDSLKSTITETLKGQGIKVNEELGLTVGNISSLKTLTIDGTKTNITTLKALTEATSLQELTLKNVTLSNLDGLENLSLINYIYFYNCDIEDYSKLATCYKLKYLYFHFTDAMTEEVSNKQITALGNALKNATNISNLQYFGAYGVNLLASVTYKAWYPQYNGQDFASYSSTTRSNLTDISGLANFADNIKKSIKHIYLNNNKLNSISSLNGFSSINEMFVEDNATLTSLSGLENNTSVQYLAAHNCAIMNLEGLNGTTNLARLSLFYNKALGSLNGIEKNISLYSLMAYGCNITDISALEKLTNLAVLYLNSNVNLENVSVITNCQNLIRLYLASNTKMIASEVAELQEIFNNCGTNYSVPSKYYSVMPNLNSYDYINYGLTDTSSEFLALKGKTNITRLRLQGNTNLTNEALNEVLSTLTGLQYLSLNNISNLTSIEWIKNVTGLIELDLRGTNVTSDTDISLLNSYGTNLKTLVINNSKIIIADIEDALVNINNNWSTAYLDSWIYPSCESARGAICLANEYDFSTLTKLTNWRAGALSANSTNTVDLSNCTNLKNVWIFSNQQFKLPYSVTQLEIGNGTSLFDLSLCNQLATIITSNTIGNNVISSVITLPDDNVLSTLSCYIAGISYSNLDFLGEFNANNLKKLEVFGYSQRSNGLSDIKGLQYAPNITNLNINHSDVASLEGIQYLTNLEILNASNHFTKFSDISYLSNLTKLKIVNIANQKISVIPDLSKLTQLESLNLSTNYVTDVSPLNGLIKNGTTTLRTLNLAQNGLEEYTISGVDNIEILRNLKSAGTTSINVSLNNFFSEPEI